MILLTVATARFSVAMTPLACPPAMWKGSSFFAFSPTLISYACVYTCVFTIDFLMGMREYLLVVSGCLPLVISDVNCLFMCY